MLKKFLVPSLEKLLIYLFFVIIFMAETLLIRSIFEKDYIMLFISSIYDNFFKGLVDYVNFFTVAFFYYLVILGVLYLLSCLVILIYEKTKE